MRRGAVPGRSSGPAAAGAARRRYRFLGVRPRRRRPGNRTSAAAPSLGAVLDAIVAGSATPAEMGDPMWWTWRKFFRAVAAVITVYLAASVDGGGIQYAGVGEEIFD